MTGRDNKGDLFDWELEINKRIKKHPWIRVRNNVDSDNPPRDFKFILHNIPNPRARNEVMSVGCQCEICYKSKECCPALGHKGNRVIYNAEGLLDLKAAKTQAIYECNSSCACNFSCVNRVVQKGTTVRLEIFKTSNCRGWGLKTLAEIKKGQFVVEYMGEILTPEEVSRREPNCNDEMCTYLFNLNYGDSDSPFVIDAASYGNAARFINHSCLPNLEVHPVFVDELDARLPRLALFALVDISRYTELTFDYYANKTKEGTVPCKCGAEKCRKFI